MHTTRFRLLPLIVALLLASLCLGACQDKTIGNRAEAEEMGAFCEAVLAEHNYARTKPKEYAEKFIKPKIANSKTMQGSELSYAQSCYNRTVEMEPLKPLVLDVNYIKAAQWFADDHRKTKVTGHVGSDGSRFWERIKRYDQNAEPTNECCSYGVSDARGVVVQLLVDEDVPSLGHRDAVLNPRAGRIGVGQAKGDVPYGVVTVIDYGV